MKSKKSEIHANLRAILEKTLDEARGEYVLAKESRDSDRELIEKVNARLKYHPVSAELEAFLAGK